MSEAAKCLRYELEIALAELAGQATRRLNDMKRGEDLHIKNTTHMKTYTNDLFSACEKAKEAYDRYSAVMWANWFDDEIEKEKLR